MDTPGHVDFAYEVSRSLAACEGALLVVDAAQGVEAQTLANVYQSIEHDHEIVPVINKIDLPAADPEGVRQEIEEIIGLDASGAVLASAKTGQGITEVLDAIVARIPPPRGDAGAPLKAMLVDSWYDPYLGVVILVRVIDGRLSKGQQVKFMAAGTTHLVDRVGCLGLLHLEIIQERLTREYDLDLITTAPSVIYEVHLRDGSVQEIHNPADWPDPSLIEAVEEPWIEATIYMPDEYLGSVLKLCQDRRGVQKNLTYVGSGAHQRAQLTYELPLNEVVFDFYDRLKSISRGYASFDYHQIGHRPGDLVKMGLLVNNEPVDALSMIVHRANADARGRGMCERLKDLIPRHLFKIPIQAAIGGKIIARETIAALRKDVTANCYGGDATRKRKLLEKQKEGKKRMREDGSVSIPQEAFIAALRMGEE